MICQQFGISEQTYYTWKRKYAGLGLSELRELRQLREETHKLKRLVADFSLDRIWCRRLCEKSCKASTATRAGAMGPNGLCDQRTPGVEADSYLPSYLAVSEASRPPGMITGAVIGIGCQSGAVWLSPLNRPFAPKGVAGEC